MPSDPHQTLRELVAGRQVVAVVGAGVSMAATRGTRVASWTGLVADGIERLAARGVDERYVRLARDLLELGDLVDAASRIRKHLSPQGYARWLTETVGALTPEEPRVPLALGALGVPLLTTNYDDLLEQVLHRQASTWCEPMAWQRVLDGAVTDVLHMHGSYRQPDSVVFDAASYQSVTDEAGNQFSLRAVAAGRHLLFVGVGAGLDDANLAGLRAFLAGVLGGSGREHYQLVLQGDVAQAQPAVDGILRVAYGTEVADLGGFLESLAPPAQVAPTFVAPRAVRRPEQPVLDLRIGREEVQATVTREGRRESSTTTAHGLSATTLETLELLDGWLRELPPGRTTQVAPVLVDSRRVLLQIGRILFDSVFRGDVLEAYTGLQDAKVPFSLLLGVDAEAVALPKADQTVDLRELPWELLFHDRHGHLSMRSAITFSRVDVPAEKPSWTPTESLRVLVVLVQPADLTAEVAAAWAPSGDYDEVIRGIVSAIGPAAGDDDARQARSDARTTVVQLPDRGTWPQFKQALGAGGGGPTPRYDVLHLIGHASVSGARRGEIAFADPDGEHTDWRDFDDVADLFSYDVDESHRPTMVFLHLCRGPLHGNGRSFARASFTELAYRLLGAGVPIVVAMQYPMQPDVGRNFTESFYRAVGTMTVAQAVRTARGTLREQGHPIGPVLYLRGHDGAMVRAPEGDEDTDLREQGRPPARIDLTVPGPSSMHAAEVRLDLDAGIAREGSDSWQ